ncbi:MAG: hypothetical protein KJO07_18780 [Deltaproteobacteria bacterium]|nr:hypothetical protein [Deltaproteobacteria bacterium]
MRSIALLIFLSVLTAPAVAPADKGEMKKEAKVHFDRAIELYSAGKYRQASDAFYRAYKVEKRIEIIFGWAQSKRLSGDCKKAVKLYKKLLRRDLPAADDKAVREGLEACGVKTKKPRAAEEDEEDEAEDEPEPAAKADPPEDSEDENEDEDEDEEAEDEGEEQKAPVAKTVKKSSGGSGGSPWYTDPIGDALLITGVIGLGVGTGYFLDSSSDRSAADEATNYEAYRTLADRASTRRTIAILATSASGAMIIGAVVRYIMRDSGGERSTSVSAWTDQNGAGLAIGGRF